MHSAVVLAGLGSVLVHGPRWVLTGQRQLTAGSPVPEKVLMMLLWEHCVHLGWTWLVVWWHPDCSEYASLVTRQGMNQQ